MHKLLTSFAPAARVAVIFTLIGCFVSESWAGVPMDLPKSYSSSSRGDLFAAEALTLVDGAFNKPATYPRATIRWSQRLSAVHRLVGLGLLSQVISFAQPVIKAGTGKAFSAPPGITVTSHVIDITFKAGDVVSRVPEYLAAQGYKAATGWQSLFEMADKTRPDNIPWANANQIMPGWQMHIPTGITVDISPMPMPAIPMVTHPTFVLPHPAVILDNVIMYGFMLWVAYLIVRYFYRNREKIKQTIKALAKPPRPSQWKSYWQKLDKSYVWALAGALGAVLWLGLRNPNTSSSPGGFLFADSIWIGVAVLLVVTGLYVTQLWRPPHPDDISSIGSLERLKWPFKPDGSLMEQLSTNEIMESLAQRIRQRAARVKEIAKIFSFINRRPMVTLMGLVLFLGLHEINQNIWLIPLIKAYSAFSWKPLAGLAVTVLVLPRLPTVIPMMQKLRGQETAWRSALRELILFYLHFFLEGLAGLKDIFHIFKWPLTWLAIIERREQGPETLKAIQASWEEFDKPGRTFKSPTEMSLELYGIWGLWSNAWQDSGRPRTYEWITLGHRIHFAMREFATRPGWFRNDLSGNRAPAYGYTRTGEVFRTSKNDAFDPVALPHEASQQLPYLLRVAKRMLIGYAAAFDWACLPWTVRRNRLAVLAEAEMQWAYTIHPKVSFSTYGELVTALDSLQTQTQTMWEQQGSPKTYEWAVLRGKIALLRTRVKEQPFLRLDYMAAHQIERVYRRSKDGEHFHFLPEAELSFVKQDFHPLTRETDLQPRWIFSMIDWGPAFLAVARSVRKRWAAALRAQSQEIDFRLPAFRKHLLLRLATGIQALSVVLFFSTMTESFKDASPDPIVTEDRRTDTAA